MNKQAAPLSLFFGGFGLLFIILGAATIGAEFMITSLLLVLFHTVMVFVAFPFFLYAVYMDPSVSKNYYLIVSVMSILNALMMFITSFLDPSVEDIFYVAAGLEFLPLPIIAERFYSLRRSQQKVVTA